MLQYIRWKWKCEEAANYGTMTSWFTMVYHMDYRMTPWEWGGGVGGGGGLPYKKTHIY